MHTNRSVSPAISDEKSENKKRMANMIKKNKNKSEKIQKSELAPEEPPSRKKTFEMGPLMRKKLNKMFNQTDEIFKDLDSHSKWMRKFRERAEDRKEGPMMKELREKLK